MIARHEARVAALEDHDGEVPHTSTHDDHEDSHVELNGAQVARLSALVHGDDD